jgi:flagellar hook-length control protein FliK
VAPRSWPDAEVAAITALRPAPPVPAPSAGAGTIAPRETLTLPHEALAQAILTRARALPENGAVELRFALDPPDLGAVRVRIEARGSHVRIDIETASHAAASALAPGIARISNELHHAGYPDPQISLGPDASHDGHANARSRDGGSSHEGGRPHRRDADGESATRSRRESGRLDRTA